MCRFPPLPPLQTPLGGTLPELFAPIVVLVSRTGIEDAIPMTVQASPFAPDANDGGRLRVRQGNP